MASTSTAAITADSRPGLSRDIIVLAAVVILGTIMTVLDLTIVNVAIPAIGAGRRSAPSNG